jgi:hypothetical protein
MMELDWGELRGNDPAFDAGLASLQLLGSWFSGKGEMQEGCHSLSCFGMGCLGGADLADELHQGRGYSGSQRVAERKSRHHKHQDHSQLEKGVQE